MKLKLITCMGAEFFAIAIDDLVPAWVVTVRTKKCSAWMRGRVLRKGFFRLHKWSELHGADHERSNHVLAKRNALLSVAFVSMSVRPLRAPNLAEVLLEPFDLQHSSRVSRSFHRREKMPVATSWSISTLSETLPCLLRHTPQSFLSYISPVIVSM